MSIGEVCNREVIVVRRDEAIMDAVRLMRQYHVGDVVIVDESQGERLPVGILTDRDIVIELLAQEVDLDAVSVGDAMSYELLTLNEQEELLDALKQMRSRGVRRAPVVNSRGALVGIITVDDLLELLMEQVADLVALINRERRLERERHR